MTLDLGFVEKSEPWMLESRFFPSKVGGKPAWLELKNIPAKKDLECEYCGDPCTFLCQVYAPFDCEPSCFHRTVYVFVCRRFECCRANSNGNLKVFRSQLARNNQYYPSEPPIERRDWGTDIGVHRWTRTCHVCGIYAPNHCGKCKAVNYCCRQHQIQDWKADHKNSCGGEPSPTASETFLFPEYELVIEASVRPLPDTDENDDSEDVKGQEREMCKYEEMVQKGETGVFHNENVESDLIKLANGVSDEAFSIFRESIGQHPDQVLRYDRGGKVLYISSDNQINELPKCNQCGGELQFEFQIMPQLLNFLDLKDPLESIDWGILVVCTCKDSCTPLTGYVKEYIWKQDMTQDSNK